MKNLRKYIISVVIGLFTTLGVLLLKNTFIQKDILQFYSDLTDAFFIPGVFFISFGLLILATNEHIFDTVTYGVHAVFNAFRKRENRKLKRSYIEYRQHREENGKVSFLYLINVGLLFVAISIVFLLLFNSKYYG